MPEKIEDAIEKMVEKITHGEIIHGSIIARLFLPSWLPCRTGLDEYPRTSFRHSREGGNLCFFQNIGSVDYPSEFILSGVEGRTMTSFSVILDLVEDPRFSTEDWKRGLSAFADNDKKTWTTLPKL